MNWYIFVPITHNKMWFHNVLFTTNYKPTMLFNSCVSAVLWFEHFRVIFYFVIDNVQVVLFWCVVHYVTFSFWFILNFYHVSASYVSLTVKNRQVYCTFENTIGDLFLNMFSSSSYILYIIHLYTHTPTHQVC